MVPVSALPLRLMFCCSNSVPFFRHHLSNGVPVDESIVCNAMDYSKSHRRVARHIPVFDRVVLKAAYVLKHDFALVHLKAKRIMIRFINKNPYEYSNMMYSNNTVVHLKATLCVFITIALNTHAIHENME